jgi:hypothetical protein
MVLDFLSERLYESQSSDSAFRSYFSKRKCSVELHLTVLFYRLEDMRTLHSQLKAKYEALVPYPKK